MSTEVFPANDFERSGKLVSQLGSFWNGIFDDSAFVEDLSTVLTQEARQIHRIARENLASVSRLTVPVHGAEKWAPLVLRASERQEGTLVDYGDSFVFGPQITTGQTLQFGVPIDAASAYPIPDNIVDIGQVVNLRVTPTVALSKNVDYFVDTQNNLLVFRDDPLENTKIAKQDVFDSDGVKEDEESTIWLDEVRLDKQHIYKQFGYVISLLYDSSEEYRNILNKLFDNLMLGNTYDALVCSLALMADVPLAKEQGEVVEDISEREDEILIITDKNVYRCNINATPTVVVGQVLNSGQLMTDTISVNSLHRGAFPSSVKALTAGRGILLGGEYGGELTFENKTVDTVVTTDSEGHTKIEWEIGGSVSDVALFWETVHNNGIASGTTLANLLDTRTNKVGEPQASNLPTTINPLEFLVENLLRNIILVEMNINTFGRRALDVGNANVFRRLIPPQYLALLLVTVAVDEEGAPVVALGGDSHDSFDGADTVTQPVPSTLVGDDSFIFS